MITFLNKFIFYIIYISKVNVIYNKMSNNEIVIIE